MNGTQTGFHGGPFQQTYSYDAWDNLKERTGAYWSEDDVTGLQTYDSHSRNAAWSYDADGNLLSMNEQAPNELPFVAAQHIHDAAGRHFQTTQTTSMPSAFNPNLVFTKSSTTQREYDGDGLQLKQVISEQTNSGSPQSNITYYLRSSALQGNIVLEYNGQGVQQTMRIFAGDEQIASVVGGQVEWRYTNPVTGEVRESNGAGNLGAATHLDPAGVDVGATDPGSTQDPSAPEPLPQAGAYASLLPRSAGGMKTCKLEGFVMGCGWMKSWEDTGHLAPVNQIQFTERRWVKPSPIGLRLKLPANPFDSFLPNAADGTPIVRTNTLESNGHCETDVWTVSFPEIPQNTFASTETLRPSCHLKVRGLNRAPLSKGDPLRFPWGITRLGATNNSEIWGWAVEIRGSVSDDVSTWKYGQTYVDHTTVTVPNIVTGELETRQLKDMTKTEYIDGYKSQPRGGHRFFGLDVPGIIKSEYYADAKQMGLVTMHTTMDFTSTLTNGDVTCKAYWSVSFTVTNGVMNGATFR